MGQLERLTVYPVKGLDGISLDRVGILDGGTLAFDREFALYDSDDEIFNGKRSDRIHRLSSEFDPQTYELSVETAAGDPRCFDLETERDRAARWFSSVFDVDLTLRRDQSLGYVDRRDMGPSVISTATINEIASWFEELTPQSVRRRLRANIEVSGVPAFWEDRFLGDDAPTFEIGTVRFDGVSPCGRCVVPERDPDTGERQSDFRRRFIHRRKETRPPWTSEAAFDHWYTTMILTRVIDDGRDHELVVGDSVTEFE